MQSPSGQRTPRLAPDHHDLAALTTWIGCPHCGGPVDLRLPLERTRRDLLTGILFFLAKRPTHAQIQEQVRKARAEAEERLMEPLRTWPEE